MSERLVTVPANASWVWDDGGRNAAGKRGRANDCVVRAIAIATNEAYRDVYRSLIARVRDGVHREKYQSYLESRGWQWTPTMGIGTGCIIHLSARELPPGRLIVKISKHMVAVIDGIIHDTYDPSRNGNRCIYGYFHK